MTWLRHEEFVPLAPDKPGTIHVYHCKTGHGNDRLYITRKDDNDTILAHCFHCGARGYYSVVGSGKISRAARASTYENLDSHGTYSTNRAADSRGKDIDRSFREAQLSDSRRLLANWPTKAKRWWLECGLTIPEQEYHGVTYNEDDNTIDMPLWNSGTVTGMCCRTIDDGEHIPKYVLVGDRTSHVVTAPVAYDVLPLVIVEDMRSAYKLARLTSTYPMLGTELQSSQIIKILEAKPDKALIFLDNDSEQVRRKARAIKKRLEIYLPCGIITVEQDPKNLSTDELRKIIS